MPVYCIANVMGAQRFTGSIPGTDTILSSQTISRNPLFL